MKKITITLAIMLFSLGLYFFLKPEKVDNAEVARLAPPVKIATQSPDSPKLLEMTSRPRSTHLSLNDLQKRNGLDGIQRMDIESAIGRAWTLWVELKGERAQMVAFDGKTMTLFIPALHLDEEQLATQLLKELAIGVGQELAEKLWNDSATRDGLIYEAGFGEISTDYTYVFTKTTEGNPLIKYGPEQYSVFDVEIRQGVTIDGIQPRWRQRPNETRTHSGFTYIEPYNQTMIGWNAMAKAPAGYFRAAPILGVASRPDGNPSVTIVEDLVTYESEIRNQRFPGSKDLLKADGTIKPLN